MDLKVRDIVRHKPTGKRYKVKEIEWEAGDYSIICGRLSNDNIEYEKTHFSGMELEKVGDDYRETEYRKRRQGNDSWHWCRNCPEWPTNNPEQRYIRPDDNLCKKCEEKEKANDCIGLS